MAQVSKTQDKPVLTLPTKVYNGVKMLVNEIEDIEKMDILEDDIWICTYLRSGTTLTMEMVYLIQTLDFQTAKSVPLEARVPIVEVVDDRYPYFKGNLLRRVELTGDIIKKFGKERYGIPYCGHFIYNLSNIYLNHGLKILKDLKRPRMIKSHLPFFLLPQQLQQGKGKIINLMWNPKDVVTSYYRLMQWWGQVDETNTFDKFVDSFVEGEVLYGSWSKHVLGYWDQRNNKNLLMLRYEDVVLDMTAAVRRIANYLNCSLSDDDVAKIVDHCHVDKMRNNEMTNWTHWKDFTYLSDKGGFINKGRPGAWHEVFTDEQSAKIDEVLREFDGSGLHFEET